MDMTDKKNRYVFEETKEGLIEIYDRENDKYVTEKPVDSILEAFKAVENYEDNEAEAAWYRSTQDGTSEAERSEQQYRNQQLK